MFRVEKRNKLKMTIYQGNQKVKKTKRVLFLETGLQQESRDNKLRSYVIEYICIRWCWTVNSIKLWKWFAWEMSSLISKLICLNSEEIKKSEKVTFSQNQSVIGLSGGRGIKSAERKRMCIYAQGRGCAYTQKRKKNSCSNSVKLLCWHKFHLQL